MRSRSTVAALLTLTCGLAAAACSQSSGDNGASGEDAFSSAVPALNEEASERAQAAANEAERFEQLAADINQIQSEQARTNGGIDRGFHPKSHACVLGRVEVVEDRPEESKYGIFAETRSYPAWIRLSNATSKRQSDKIFDIRGIAVKVMDVPGQKILEGGEQATTQDFLAVNSPTLVFKDGFEFMKFQKAFSASGLELVDYAVHNLSVGIVSGLLKTLRPVTSVFTERYWSASAYKLGPRAIHYSFTPCERLARGLPGLLSSKNYLRADAVSTIENGEGCFDLSVQYQHDAVRQPVEDTSVEWNENEAPFARVARVTLTPQDMSSAESASAEAFCEGLVWTPWHSLPEHRPLGNANRARKIVMKAAQKFRGAPQPPQEPSGDETFE